MNQQRQMPVDGEQVIEVRQGSQPIFGDLLVGVQAVGVRDGVPLTRLWLRDSMQAHAVDLRVGESEESPGHGTLMVVDIKPEPDQISGLVTLRFLPTSAG